jgi:hypothetical protein
MGHICHAGSEPRLEDLLADPILRKLLRADRIEEGDVRQAVAAARRALYAAEEPISWGDMTA